MTKYIVICAYEQKKMGGKCIKVNYEGPFETRDEAQEYADFLWDEPYVIHDVEVVEIE